MVYFSARLECCSGLLHVWLLSFMALQLAWPLCIRRMTVVLLGWCLGAVHFLDLPGSCHRLRALLLEAMVIHAAQALLALGAGVADLLSRPSSPSAASPSGNR